MLQSVAILYHPRRRQAVAEAEWLGAEMRSHGVQTIIGDGWKPEVVNEVCCGKDLAVALGGDGTIIHVARLAAPSGIPVVGVNLGRVGFLAELTPAALHDKVDALIAGRFWIERRTMLDVEWQGDGKVDRFLSLNEVAVMRGVSPRAIHVTTLLDGENFTTFTADGVLVATASGSTAYSLAAGGPIMYPEATDFMLTPVAPHLHIGRSVIIPADSTVTLHLSTDRAAVMSVDGVEERLLKPNHAVNVRRSGSVACFARLGARTYFYSALADRLK